jgi:hypothetical protein
VDLKFTDQEYHSARGNSTRCTAHLKGNGNRCKKWAMAGSTVCKKHGGAGFIRGKYSSVLKKGTLASAYERHLLNEGYKDLKDELALMRAFTEAAVLHLNGVNLNTLTPAQASVVMTMVGEVRALVEATTRVDQRISLSLTITDLHHVIQQIFAVIKRHIKDVAVLKVIGDELSQLSVPETI